MKKIFLSLVVVISSLMAEAQIVRAELTATGLTCSMCSRATYKQLTSLPQVEKVDTDLDKTAFILHFKKGSTVNVSDIKSKVEDAGFSVGELVVVFNFKNQAVANKGSFIQNGITYTFMDSKNEVLDGETKVKVLDKGFVVDKEYKKLLKKADQYPGYANTNNNAYHIKTL